MPRWNVSELYFLFVCLRSLWREMKAASEEQHREGEKQRRRNKKNENRSQTYRVALSSPMALEGHESGMNFYR